MRIVRCLFLAFVLLLCGCSSRAQSPSVAAAPAPAAAPQPAQEMSVSALSGKPLDLAQSPTRSPLLIAPPVATRCTPVNNEEGRPNWGGVNGDTGGNYQIRHYALFDTSKLYFLDYNPDERGKFDSPRDTVVQNAITLHRSLVLRAPGSADPATPIQVTWGGKSSTSIAPGEFVTSDPVHIPAGYTQGAAHGILSAGDYFYERVFVTGEPSTLDQHAEWPVAELPEADQLEGSSHSPTETDKSMSGASADYADKAGFIYVPVAIMGVPASGSVASHPIVGVYGDSIASGTGDNYETNSIIAASAASKLTGNPISYARIYGKVHGAGAFVRLAESSRIGIVNTGIYGDIFYFGDFDKDVRFPLFDSCDYVVCEMGTNRLPAFPDGVGDANVTSNVLTFIKQGIQPFIAVVKARSKAKVILMTYLPRTANTGTTPKLYEHTRVAINNYLRANYRQLGAVGLVDWTQAVESDTSQAKPNIALTTGSTGLGSYSSTVGQQSLTGYGSWCNIDGALTTVDGTHPSDVGYAALAAYLQAHLIPLVLR